MNGPPLSPWLAGDFNTHRNMLQSRHMTMESSALIETPSQAIPAFNLGDSANILAALKKERFVIVRQALPQNVLENYRDNVIAFYAYLDQCAKKIDTETRESARNVLNNLIHQNGFSLMLEMDFYFPTFSGFRLPFHLIKESGLLGIANQFFGSRDVGFLVDYTSVRRQSPRANEKALSFHQDAEAATTDSGLVFWAPLTPINARTPGLEVDTGNKGEFFTHVGDLGPFSAIPSPEHVVGSTAALPEMAVGDVFIFDFSVVHRTHMTAQMTETRYSIDARCIPFEALPDVYTGNFLLMHHEPPPPPPPKSPSWFDRLRDFLRK